MSATEIKRALISVSDKTGIVEFATALSARGIEIYSTGGTAERLTTAGIPVKTVDSLTGFPEMMDGRLKTLHPRVHGGILARRDIDAEALSAHDISTIDLVVVNLYPFREAITKADATLATAVENIDIGGPTMIRAAAKNHQWVTVIVDPKRYDDCLEQLETTGAVSEDFRRLCCLDAFEHTAFYDSLISQYFRSEFKQPPYPESLSLSFEKVQDLRYGENPHQSAAFYRAPLGTKGLADATQHQGKALSFNNIADADAALSCVKAFPSEMPTCVIVKHANPCGVALSDSLIDAYDRAYAADSTSAFGGIIAFNQTVDAQCMDTILSRQFVEVILAPAFDEEALSLAQRKPNVRLLSLPFMQDSGVDIKRVCGGLLVQSLDAPEPCSDVSVVTKAQPSAEQLDDLAFAWQVCQFVKSNAIVFAKNRQTVGIGAGQMSRVYSTRIAKEKALEAGLSASGAVMASDAFFPFPDSIEQAAEAGISAIIQPGGSKRDAEVIAAADAAGIVMVFTGVRHFKH